MKSIFGLVDRLTTRVIGTVDAGACDVNFRCCCKGTGRPHWRLNCYGHCEYRADLRCDGPCQWA
jgi:hypothetical protein